MSDITSVVDRLVQQYLVFDGEFEAFTPWWGGNEFGYTFYPRPHYPEAKEIIGKTKWTIRTLLGHVPRELGFTEGNNAMASQLKVVVESLNEGNRYFTKVPQVTNDRKEYTRLLTAMREAGYSLLFEKNATLVNEQLKHKEFYELYKLLAIPRFYLKAMGRKEMLPNQVMQELLKSQPMKPGLRIRIKVYSRNKEISRLFVSAMLITLKLLGIGSAANRGFGRFKLVKTNYAIEGISENVEPTRVKDNQFPRFPSKEEIREIRPVCASIGGKKYTARTVEGVLSAIGIATLKSTWKANCGNFTGSGREYHTWVLGLPREVGGKGYVGVVKRQPKIVISPSVRRQSYIVISPTVDNGVLLIPFYANDYHCIFHQDHGRVEVTRIKRVTPTCTPKQASSSVKDHVNTALDWLYELLSCSR
ncbi:hypothetical protein [Saccharolobus islandicus]|uniref:CRISPR-associated protein, Cmr1 n=1 Tax=Saccharolobus islandicus LAL14/1 TaxID=1241935 RepID=M9U4Y3_SACIS|nr:hypothetical protein [Sulfolobus islandicus]AGJ62069.1 CRISPR-associated protein, Cmr1 [Sulfolobus islandicus LAL14/1]